MIGTAITSPPERTGRNWFGKVATRVALNLLKPGCAIGCRRDGRPGLPFGRTLAVCCSNRASNDCASLDHGSALLSPDDIGRMLSPQPSLRMRAAVTASAIARSARDAGKATHGDSAA